MALTHIEFGNDVVVDSVPLSAEHLSVEFVAFQKQPIKGIQVGFGATDPGSTKSAVVVLALTPASSAITMPRHQMFQFTRSVQVSVLDSGFSLEASVYQSTKTQQKFVAASVSVLSAALRTLIKEFSTTFDSSSVIVMVPVNVPLTITPYAGSSFAVNDLPFAFAWEREVEYMSTRKSLRMSLSRRMYPNLYFVRLKERRFVLTEEGQVEPVEGPATESATISFAGRDNQWTSPLLATTITPQAPFDPAVLITIVLVVVVVVGIVCAGLSWWIRAGRSSAPAVTAAVPAVNMKDVRRVTREAEKDLPMERQFDDSASAMQGGGGAPPCPVVDPWGGMMALG